MTVRVLLAAVVALALVGSAMPAVEEAQRVRADHQVTQAAERLDGAAAAMARSSDPVPPGVPGARRRVRLDLPDATAGVSIRIPLSNGIRSDPARSIRLQRPGREATSYEVSVPMRPSGSTSAGSVTDPLVLREDCVLTLTYRLIDGRPVVVVSRGFKAGDRTNPAHAGSSSADG